MNRLVNAEYRTPIKIYTDIHAGGNFFWNTYYEKLVFKENSNIELIRVEEKSYNGILNDNELMCRGIYYKNEVGYYDFEIRLNYISSSSIIEYCCKIINNDTIICHGITRRTLKGDVYSSISEIYTRI